MTPEVVRQAQQLFEEGHSQAEVARGLDISYDTLRKAIDQGRASRLTNSNTHSHLGLKVPGSYLSPLRD